MGMIIGLIIAGVAAFFVYQDASKRGMNAIGWAIGVFLLLIIFLPLYFFMRKPLLVSPVGMGPGGEIGPTNPPSTL